MKKKFIKKINSFVQINSLNKKTEYIKYDDELLKACSAELLLENQDFKYSYTDYKNELKEKKAYILELFKEDLKSNPQLLKNYQLYAMNEFEYKNYRHKAVLSATNLGNMLKLGLYKPKSKTVKPLLDSIYHDEQINLLFKELEKILNKYKIKAYDDKTKTGSLKHVFIRKSEFEKTFSIIFCVNAKTGLPGSKDICNEILLTNKNIGNIVLNLQKEHTKFVLNGDSKTLFGSGFLFEKVLEYKLRFSVESFLQVNPKMMNQLYKYIDDFFTKKQVKGVLLDLFCGSGAIGLSVGKNFDKLVGYEVNKKAIIDAKYNASVNGFKNTKFVEFNCSMPLQRNDEKIDVIILDPTRDGLSLSFMESVVKLSPKLIVFIGCDANHQKNNCLYFKNKDYKIIHLATFDMFPLTNHVENLIVLEKRL